VSAPEPEPIEELLDLLGNKTRRRILEFLSKEPLYITKMIDMMNVKAQAIMRHLRKLEQRGFVRSYERASLRGPPRKYYTITHAMSANVIIGPNTFSLKLTSDATGEKKRMALLQKHVASKLESSDRIKAFQLILGLLSREKPTKEIETAVSVLESLKKSLTEEMK